VGNKGLKARTMWRVVLGLKVRDTVEDGPGLQPGMWCGKASLGRCPRLQWGGPLALKIPPARRPFASLAQSSGRGPG
jgi:hypothetical protein